MISSASPGLGRALAALLAGAVFVGLSAGAGLPLWRLYQERADEILELQHRTQRFAKIAASLPRLEKDLLAVERSLANSQYALPEENANFAAATLQERIKVIVQQSGGQLISTQVLPPERIRGFDRVTVRVQITADTAALQQILFRLESQPPYLALDELTVVPAGLGAMTRQSPRSGAPEPSLQVNLNVSGWMRPPATDDA